MIWQQAALSFLVWLLYGTLMRRRSGDLRIRLRETRRKTKVLLGSVGLIGGAILLLGGLWQIAALGGIGPSGLTIWAWVGVTLLGLVFVHLQVLGAAAMITLIQESETAHLNGASDTRRSSDESSERPE
ncbi:MAG TPA: hypothetical protein PLL78_12480 [Fimbriimonadaceae bacterium]|nr:hypothetical protein [Fimbriimonadaceae bacterium]HRJ97493.1 hypothetical protein [Fimbriimonadaceae bacterium]